MRVGAVHWHGAYVVGQWIGQPFDGPSVCSRQPAAGRAGGVMPVCDLGREGVCTAVGVAVQAARAQQPAQSLARTGVVNDQKHFGVWVLSHGAMVWALRIQIQMLDTFAAGAPLLQSRAGRACGCCQRAPLNTSTER